MSVGILGGVFDPPHLGHLALARGAVERFCLIRLLVLVAAHPGHKGVVLDAPARLRLAQAVFVDVPGAEVRLDDHAFTIDLVGGGAYRDALFIIGADELVAFPTWKEPQRVLDEVRLAVGTRPGYPRERLDAAIARLDRADRIELFELAEPRDISSTEVRDLAAAGEPIDDLVPAAVAELIAREGFYRRTRGYTGAIEGDLDRH
jgi:nicotinate-nucleotide adenylyltransferase